MIVFSPCDRIDDSMGPGFSAADIVSERREPLNNDHPSPQLLVVQQRGGTIIRDGAKRKLPSYMGLPKGSADAGDPSAFHTAIRELREETGIDIDRDSVPNGASATVSPVVFVITREEVREVSIYFAVLLKSRPNVVVCAEEIIGHQWVSADQITEIKEISIPTGMLFRAMGEMGCMRQR
jgi:8-oxo-dGTP pyrophosphatase MutT (NUDIX family)